MYNRVIFVCDDNTSLSPVALALFNAEECDMEIDAISRGLVVLFPEPVNPKAEDLLARHKLRMPVEVTTQFSSAEVTPATLVLTMDKRQKRRIATDFYINENVFTLAEFADANEDILDPYGRNMEFYETSYRQISEYIHVIAYKLMHDKTINESWG